MFPPCLVHSRLHPLDERGQNLFKRFLKKENVPTIPNKIKGISSRSSQRTSASAVIPTRKVNEIRATSSHVSTNVMLFPIVRSEGGGIRTHVEQIKSLLSNHSTTPPTPLHPLDERLEVLFKFFLSDLKGICTPISRPMAQHHQCTHLFQLYHEDS